MRKGLDSLILGARERVPGIYVLSPLQIPAGHRRPWTRVLNSFLLKAAVTRAVWRRNLRKPLIWTYHPLMLDVIDRVDFGPLLYHCVDDLAAVPGVDAASFRIYEEALLRRAQVVFATAPALAEHCRQHNPNTHYLSNVVDAEHFGSALEPGLIPAQLAAIPEPRLVYHGVLSDFKIDFRLLLDAARLRSDWSWVLIGEEREGQKSPLVAELKALPNVHFLGYKPYADLPDYLRGMQVGLLPSLINDYTRGMFPMKYYEYLAAGLPVVSTPLDFTRACGEGKGLRCGATPAAFVAAVETQLNHNSKLKNEMVKLVNGNTWHERSLRMLASVENLI